MQRADPIAPVVNIDDSDAAPLSIAEPSGQTLALVIVSGSSLTDLGEDGRAMIDISTFTTAKILSERSRPCGVEYWCWLEPL